MFVTLVYNNHYFIATINFTSNETQQCVFDLPPEYVALVCNQS